MGRPPLAVGTYGSIKTTPDAEGGFRARVYVRDPDGRRREVSRWRDTKAGAERALRAAVKDRTVAGDGDGDLGPDTRLEVVAERWLAQVLESDKATNTKDLYRKTVRKHVIPAVGGLRLREATVPRIDLALQTIRAASGHGTAKTTRSVLSGVLAMAVRLGALPANPVREASPIAAGEAKTIRALTVAEAERISDVPRSSQRAVDLDLPDLIDWCLGTGMRIGEACAIRESALDLEAGTVEVNATVVRVRGVGLVVQERPKTAAGWRVLALPEDLVDMLRRRAGELRLEGSPTVATMNRHGTIRQARDRVVFLSPLGKLRDPSNTLADLREVLDAIDRPDGDEVGPFGWVTSHVFRKTVATRLDEAQMTPRQIADVLGHSHPSMTQDVYMGRKVVSAETATILARPARVSA
jgi:integrase